MTDKWQQEHDSLNWPSPYQVPLGSLQSDLLMTANSDFGKDIADVYRGIKEDFSKKESVGDQNKQIDRSVREQVNSDIDSLIEKHENRKPFPIINIDKDNEI